MTPINDRVVVKRLNAETKSPGGLFIPEMAKEKPVLAKVVAVGPGSVTDTGTRVPMQVKVNDTVMFAKYSGSEFVHEGEDLLVLEEADLLCIV